MPQMAPIISLPLYALIAHLIMFLMAMVFFSSTQPTKKCTSSNLMIGGSTWMW